MLGRSVGLLSLALALAGCGDGPTGVGARATYDADAASILVLNHTDDTIYAIASDEMHFTPWEPSAHPRLAVEPGGTRRIPHTEIRGFTTQTEWVAVDSWHIVSTAEGQRARMHPVVRVRIRQE